MADELIDVNHTNHNPLPGQQLGRFRNGKITDIWLNWDTLGLLQQVGAIPAMA